MSCGGSQFGDGDVVDFASAQQMRHYGSARQQPMMSEESEDYYNEPSEVYADSLHSEGQYHESPHSMYEFAEEEAGMGSPLAAGSEMGHHEEEIHDVDWHDDYGDGLEIEKRNFLVPFEITVKPVDAESDYVPWSLKSVYPKKFSIPGNKEFGEEAVLVGIDADDVTHDFPDDIALQFSMKAPTVTDAERNNPESEVGERLFGPMGLGSFKRMPVHQNLPSGARKDIPVMIAAPSTKQPFLEKINAGAIKANKPVWTEQALRTKGVFPSKGKLMVEHDHPVIKYISCAGQYGDYGLAEAGDDHYSMSKKAFHRVVDKIMSEAATNLKLSDARQHLRIFAMRPIATKGKMAESTWKDPRGLFDKITASTPEAQEAAKARILGKKYSIKGNLCLTYAPIQFRS